MSQIQVVVQFGISVAGLYEAGSSNAGVTDPSYSQTVPLPKFATVQVQESGGIGEVSQRFIHSMRPAPPFG